MHQSSPFINEILYGAVLEVLADLLWKAIVPFGV